VYQPNVLFLVSTTSAISCKVDYSNHFASNIKINGYRLKTFSHIVEMGCYLNYKVFDTANRCWITRVRSQGASSPLLPLEAAGCALTDHSFAFRNFIDSRCGSSFCLLMFSRWYVNKDGRNTILARKTAG